MRLSEATALADLEIRDYDASDDLDALCLLTEAAQQFSPIVGLEQLDKKIWAGRHLLQPEGMLLDITGLASFFHGEDSLLCQVGKWLEERNYFGCLGIANTVGAAWALANYGTRSGKLGGDLRQGGIPPCRYCVASTGNPTSAQSNQGIALVDIEKLPLAALRLEQPTLDSLRRLGIRTIEELQQLPRSGMAGRLGESLLARWDQALGCTSEPIVTLHSLPDWCLEQTLEFPTQNRDTIAELVRRLSSELATRLGRRGEGALRIVCRLDLLEKPPLVLQLGLFRPTNDAQHLEMLLAGQLEQEFRKLESSQLWRLSLQATLTAPLVWRQSELFDAAENAGRRQIARLVDTLSSRLGRKQVLGAQTCRDAQPELAFTLQPLTGRRPDGQPQDTVRKLSSRLASRRAEPAPGDPLRRPLHLFCPPIELASDQASPVPGQLSVKQPSQGQPSQVLSPVSELPAAPLKFRYQGHWYTIVAISAPERLESGWWRGPSARRDYYRAITERGDWWWLYRDLTSCRWYLHGLFD
jgi:protein ImuB